MKKLILSIVFLLSSAIASGQVLTCDSQSGVTQYRIDGTIITDAVNGAAAWDISGITGTHNGTLEAGRPHILDGVDQGTYVWSDPVPFVLTAPEKPLSSTGIGIVPQVLP